MASILAPAKMVQISPSSSTPKLADLDLYPYFARTSHNEAQQGIVSPLTLPLDISVVGVYGFVYSIRVMHARTHTRTTCARTHKHTLSAVGTFHARVPPFCLPL
jgi:hypothetical protein